MLREHDYLANGEIGVVARYEQKFRSLKVVFSGRGGKTFDYYPNQFGEDGAPLELAYALTAQKAQGSQFDKVFMVLPQQTRLLSREQAGAFRDGASQYEPIPGIGSHHCG